MSTKTWDAKHSKWLRFFPKQKDAPPGGWSKYLNATWMPRDEWFPRYHLYLKSSAWKGRRSRVMFIAGGKCQLCPSTTRLEVHHVTYERVGNERDADLRVLCHSCHVIVGESCDRYLPMDYALREHTARLAELKRRKAEANKPKTRRRPMGETAPLKDRC